jgi:flagellar biosynthesis/type III secretory pathway chaperone
MVWPINTVSGVQIVMREELVNMSQGLEEQVALLEALRECVALERESLIQVDLARLWTLMERKQQLLRGLESAAGNRSAGGTDPRGFSESRSMRDLSMRAAHLQAEIKARSMENSHFIQETLDFLTGLIGSIADGAETSSTYEGLRKASKTKGALMLRREV